MRTAAAKIVRLRPVETLPSQKIITSKAASVSEEHSRLTIAKAAAARDTPAKAYEVRADKPVGLLLRVMPSGLRTYYVQVARGKRVRIGEAGPFTFKQAVERANAILRDPEAATKKKADGITLAEYIKEHYEQHALARLKNGAISVARVRAIWGTLLKKRMTDINAAEVDRLRNKRLAAGLQPATVNRDIAALSGIFSHWVENTKGTTHPLGGLESLKVADDETIRYLTPKESQKLRQALSDRDAEAAKARVNANRWRSARVYELLPEITGYCDHLAPMVLLSMNTGVRQGELFGLDWAQVDMTLKTITVLASNAKGNATRVIPLNVEALAVLAAVRPTPAVGLVFKSPVTGGRFNNVKKAWSELTSAVGIPDLRWHDLRHDFASQLVMRGAPLYTVQKLMGHKSAKMTQRYAKLAPGVLADAVALLGVP